VYIYIPTDANFNDVKKGTYILQMDRFEKVADKMSSAKLELDVLLTKE
jgi:hypothetical protein